jgi:hypothetical protein
MRAREEGMKTLTLTPRDLAQFAESGQHALRLFRGQYALIRPKFPTVTDEAVAAMTAAVRADPEGTGKTPGIDVAVYFAALFEMGAHNFDAAAKMLERDADAATLHSIMQQTYACANTINALTLLSEGGLMPQLHMDEAQSVARKTVASNAASKRHAKTNDAKLWVQAEWLRDSHEYQSKIDFAKIHAPLVAQKYAVSVKPETIVDNWLNLK